MNLLPGKSLQPPRAASMVRACVLAHWIFLGAILWLSSAILLGQQCLWQSPDSNSFLLALGLFTMLGLWLLQIVNVIWLAFAVRRPGWAIIAGSLQWNPLLGTIGLLLLYREARQQLKGAGIRLNPDGSHPEDWRQFVAGFSQKCPNCGEPLLAPHEPCPMCGHLSKL